MKDGTKVGSHGPHNTTAIPSQSFERQQGERRGSGGAATAGLWRGGGGGGAGGGGGVEGGSKGVTAARS